MLYQPELHATKVAHVEFGYQPNMKKLSELVDADAVIYIGTGDGNVAENVRKMMTFLSEENVPQVICSSVPLRREASHYEAGIMPKGVTTSVLPVAATTSKLAVILGGASHLQGRARQEYVLGCFREDMANEYAHLKDSIELANRVYASIPQLRLTGERRVEGRI